MRKFLTALPLVFGHGLACAQAAPVEQQAGMEAVIIFGVVVLVGIVSFLIFMARHNAKKGEAVENK